MRKEVPMNKLKIYLNFLKEKLKIAVNRFPETILLSMLAVVLGIALNRTGYGEPLKETLERLLMVNILALIASATATIACERTNQSRQRRIMIQVGVLLFTGIYYMLMPEDMRSYFYMRYTALVALLFIGFVLAPYFYLRDGLSRYALYLMGKFFQTMLYSLVLYGGISMMIFTIRTLFDVNFSYHIYADVFIIISGLFSVTYFLGNVPSVETEILLAHYSKLFKTLFLYIVTPIISVYLMILYAYFIKVVFEWTLPKGMIGNLVLWHALVSVVTLFFVRDLKSDLKWLARFIKVYIPLMIVPLGMLFVAIGIRIDAYGVTMPRYFVVLLGVFSALSLALMYLKQKDTAIAVVVVLMLAICLSFYGPLSGYHMTLRNQNNRLEALLIENQLKNVAGEFVANSALGTREQRAVNEQINFLLRNYEVSDITALPPDFSRENAIEYLGFGIDYFGWYEPRAYFNVDGKNVFPEAFDVREFDYLIRLSTYAAIDGYTIYDRWTLEKAYDNDILEITSDGQVLAALDLKLLADQFYNERNEFTNTSVVMPTGEVLDLSIMFTRLSGYHEDTVSIDFFEGYIFVKKNITQP